MANDNGGQEETFTGKNTHSIYSSSSSPPLLSPPEVQHTYLPLLRQLHLIQNLFYPYSKRVEGVWVECVRVEGVWVEGVWVEGVRVEDVRVEGVWVRV